MSSVENERLKQNHFDTYQKIISNDFVDNVEVIKLNAEDFNTAKQKSYLQFYVPQLALSVTARTHQIVDLNLGGYKWEGKFKYGTLSLTSNELGVYGQISYNKRVFNIQYMSDNTAFIFEYDQEYLNSLDCVLDDSDEKLSSGVKDVGHSNRNGNGDIDVMVLYTPAAAGSGFDMNQIANTALSQ